MGLSKKELKEVYDNLWDVSFQCNDENCGIFPVSHDNILVAIGSKDYVAISFDDLCELAIAGRKLSDVLLTTSVILG